MTREEVKEVADASWGPRCHLCGGLMTPKNAKLRSELFYHDDCLPDEFRPTKAPTEPGIDHYRLQWLLRCEAAIKSMAAQICCPYTTPEQMVDQILKGDEHAKKT